MSLAHRRPLPSWRSSALPPPSSRYHHHRRYRTPSPPPSYNYHRRRRPRRPSLWDDREPQYGIPLPPPGATLAATATRNPDARKNEGREKEWVWDKSVVGNEGVESIDIDALRRLLDPGDNHLHTPKVIMGDGKISIDELRDMLNGKITTSSTGAGLGGASGGGVNTGVNNTEAADTLSRQSRRLYVGNLPADLTEADISTFFNQAMIKSHATVQSGLPIMNVYLNLDKRFAFIEIRSVPETMAALRLDGILFRGMSLRMRRPNDYKGDYMGEEGYELPKDFDPALLGIVSTQVEDGPDKVFIGGLPYHLSEDNIKELLKSYGPLKAFNLIKDPLTGQSKGFAFFQYKERDVIDKACKGLNGMVIGDKTLTVRKADGSSGVGARGGNAEVLQTRTKVVKLSNLVSEEELEDEEEMEEIKEDVESEARGFGNLNACIVPRKGEVGAGKVWLRYEKEEEAEKALATLNGRKFAGRTVEAVYFDEQRFERKEFEE